MLTTAKAGRTRATVSPIACTVVAASLVWPALAEADKIATDDKAQMSYYREVGYFCHTPEPYADLGQIVAGLKPGRESPTERTLAINLGLALDDMATAPLVLQRAREKGLGTLLPL